MYRRCMISPMSCSARAIPLARLVWLSRPLAVTPTVRRAGTIISVTMKSATTDSTSVRPAGRRGAKLAGVVIDIGRLWLGGDGSVYVEEQRRVAQGRGPGGAAVGAGAPGAGVG